MPYNKCIASLCDILWYGGALFKNSNFCPVSRNFPVYVRVVLPAILKAFFVNLFKEISGNFIVILATYISRSLCEESRK